VLFLKANGEDYSRLIQLVSQITLSDHRVCLAMGLNRPACLKDSKPRANTRGVKKVERSPWPMNSEVASTDQFGFGSRISPKVTTGTRKSQLCKPSTFQNRVRIPCFRALRTQRTISRRVRHGELCSTERYRPLESDKLEAEV
jgi:hypothetical protein